MAWVDESEFRAFHVTESATETKEEQITECLDTAKDLIVDRCGGAAQAVVEDDAVNALPQTRKLRRAQRKLAYRELLEFVSSRSRDGGIVETERDANGDTTNKYVSYSEVQKRRLDLENEALALMADYLTPEEAAETVDRTPQSGSVDIDFG